MADKHGLPSTGVCQLGLAWQLALKRFCDIIVSGLLLILLPPLLILIGLAVWIASGWPILYRWRVVGLGGRPFVGYKFRTMVKARTS
jgi:lipopolysaccharide/colanic/teichoic acid biosynthesis glycosyltransferase